MSHYLVGDAKPIDCSFRTIVGVLEKSPGYPSTTGKWKEFVGKLGMKEHVIKDLQQKLLLEMRSHVDIFIEALTNWRQANAKGATLGALIEIMEEIGLNLEAVQLRERYRILPPSEPIQESCTEQATLEQVDSAVNPPLAQQLGENTDKMDIQ